MGRLWITTLGIWLAGVCLAAPPGLELSLPSYVQRLPLKDRELLRGPVGVKFEGATQWMSLKGASLAENQVSLDHLSAYVHVRRAELFQKGERLTVSRSHRWWVPLPRFDWRPFRRIWASAGDLGVHLRLKSPYRMELPGRVHIKMVQVGDGWKPVVTNPKEVTQMLENEVDRLLSRGTFLKVFDVKIYGFGYPSDPLLNYGWKKVRGPILSLARDQIHRFWIPQAIDRLTRVSAADED